VHLFFVTCLLAIHIFQVALLGGPQNKPLIGLNAHLQECGDDGVGPLANGHPKLIRHLDGLAVLREDAKCMADGVKNGQMILPRPPWTLTR
jgi:hypothetical protein